ncbi:heterokaryon incompatibility protein-domain-containing protein [Xylariaceae sp. FL1272]|nr:heterokaryon incompatibility protein-domain-containing protein [Xylariaceae sp. FL1272]
MWLVNSGTWELRDFISHEQVPPYAILSHTWGSEEVLFRDWTSLPQEELEKMKGYQKIAYCCRQACSEGLEWVWIDTVCIDKTSSAELSEAINSMFQWYRRAAVCYAYIDDIPPGIESLDMGLEIGKSRWITRGWTLQELIAPSEVVFYSQNWTYTGRRSELSASLAAVTHIDEPYLKGRNLSLASIAQRMSWASRRKTSRKEDEAYCLLGIFDVNMPLIYGEGARAFQRLQELIMHDFPEDHSLFAWGKVVPDFSKLVYDTEHIWGSKPIEYNPELADDNYLGLLAESPSAFKDSGRFIAAPHAAAFFSQRFGALPPIPVVYGRQAVKVELVDLKFVVRHAVFHLKRHKIAQLRYVRHAMLLCGHWDEAGTKFHFVILPLTSGAVRAARTAEIVVNDQFIDAFDPNTYGIRPYFYRQDFIIGPVPPIHTGKGGILFRRYTSWKARGDFIVLSEIDSGIQDGWVNLRSTFFGPICAFVHLMTPDKKRGFGLFLLRPSPLKPGTAKIPEGKIPGALQIGFLPANMPLDLFTLTRTNPSSFGVRSQTGNKHGMLNKLRSKFPSSTKESTKSNPSFLNETDTSNLTSVWDTCNSFETRTNQFPLAIDTADPYEEWHLSVKGFCELNITIERVPLPDDPGDDEDPSGPFSGNFVDVLDIVSPQPEEERKAQEKAAALKTVAEN